MNRSGVRTIAVAAIGIGSYGVTVGAGAWLARNGSAMYAAVGARFLVAGLFVAVVLRLMQRPVIPAVGERIPLALVAGLLYAIEAICFYQALRAGSAVSATGVLLCAPTVMALAEYRSARTELTPAIWIGCGLTASGLIALAVAGGSGAIQPAGLAWALVAAIAFAAYSFAVPRFMDRTSAVTASVWSSLWVGMTVGGVGVISGDLGTPPSQELYLILGSGIATGLAFMALFVVLDRFDATSVGTAILGQGFAAAVGLGVAGAQFGFENSVGFGLVLIGSVVVRSRSETGSGSVDNPP